jgi:hypothetical protein
MCKVSQRNPATTHFTHANDRVYSPPLTKEPKRNNQDKSGGNDNERTAPIWSFEVYETKSWTTRLGNIYGVKLINRVSEYVKTS